MDERTVRSHTISSQAAGGALSMANAVYSQTSTAPASPSTAWADKPIAPRLAGKLPVITFAATALSLGLYTLIVLLLATMSCPWSKNQVGHLFAFCLYAIAASVAMLALNCYHSHYRYSSPASLTVSLLYSGSATLVAYMVLLSPFQGLCQPAGTPPGSLFASGHAGNWVVWFASLAAVGFQLVAHYYYG